MIEQSPQQIMSEYPWEANSAIAIAELLGSMTKENQIDLEIMDNEMEEKAISQTVEA